MAQYVHQYVTELLRGQTTAGQLLGVDVYGVARESYVTNLTVLTLIGMVMKKISEVAPAVTDAVWLDALNHALDSSPALPWPPDMLAQVKPGTTPPVG